MANENATRTATRNAQGIRGFIEYDAPYTFEDAPAELGGWPHYELATLRSLGLDVAEAAELRTMRGQNFWRYSPLLRLRAHGVAREHADEVVNNAYDGVQVYLDARNAGTSHEDAFELALCQHTCRYGAGEVLEDFCRVLGTGTRTVRYTCTTCGEQSTSSERRNRSGD